MQPRPEDCGGNRAEGNAGHHRVYHQNTLGKIRVIFDCSAQYHSSLNNELLQGQDLTNSLVGVLICFRQDPVAVMYDVQSMFHQAPVPESDCDLLQVLWCLNGNLVQEFHDFTSL